MQALTGIVVFACNDNHIIGFLWISKPEEDSDMDSGHVVYVGPNVTARVCRLSIGLLALQYRHVSGIRRRVRDNPFGEFGITMVTRSVYAMRVLVYLHAHVLLLILSHC